MSESVASPIPAAQVISPSAEQEISQRARHRITRRLLPFLFVLYVIAFLDRMNIGAAALQMPHDLGFSNGVGFVLHLNWQLGNVDRLLAYAIGFIVVVMAIEALITRPLERRATRWRL